MKDPRGELKSPMLHYSYRNLEDFVSKLNNQSSRESGKWLESSKGMPLSRAIRRTIDRYWRAYHKKNGKKDGMIGFILAVMGGFYQFISFAKYWQKKNGLEALNETGHPASSDKLPKWAA